MKPRQSLPFPTIGPLLRKNLFLKSATAMDVMMLCSSGQDGQHRIALERELTSIGRSPGQDIVMRDPSVAQFSRSSYPRSARNCRSHATCAVQAGPVTKLPSVSALSNGRLTNSAPARVTSGAHAG